MIMLRKIIVCALLVLSASAVQSQSAINPISRVFCSGSTFNITPLNGQDGNVPGGTTYTWSAPTGTGFTGGLAQGVPSASISGTLTLSGAADQQQSAVYTVTPSTGSPFTLTIVLNPYAAASDITVTAVSPVLCAGLSTTLNASITGGSNVTGSATYTWYSNANRTGQLATGASTSYTTPILNAGTSYYVSVNTANACENLAGNLASAAITISGVAPDVIQPTSQVVCSGISSTAPVTFTSQFSSGTIYNWVATNATGTGLAVTGSGNIPAFTPTNSSNALITASITVTPFTSTNSCFGVPRTFTIQIGPIPAASNSLATTCSNASLAFSPTGLPTGTTFTWTRSTFPVEITSSALTQNTGQSTFNPTLINSSALPVDISFTVIPRTGTPAFCPGSPFTITTTVKATPVIDVNQTTTSCSGTAFGFTLTGAIIPATTSYTWGIPTTITGSITGSSSQLSQQTAVSQTLTNNNTSNSIIRYTITPVNAGCTGSVFSGTITVFPKPVLSTTTPSTICNNVPFSYTAASATAGTTFSWTRAAVNNISNTAGAGTVSVSETLNNTGTANEQVSYQYTLLANGCQNTQNILVTIKPTLRLSSDVNKSSCSNSLFNYSAVSATLGTTLTWTRAAVAGISNTAAGGTVNISETLVNTTNAPLSVIYEYHNTSGACTDNTNLTVMVNPLPVVNPVVNQVICSGSTLGFSLTGSTVAGTAYNWINNNINIGLTSSGSGDISFLAYDATYVPIAGNITVTPAANSCNGVPMSFSITVNPAPQLSSVLTIPAICSGTVVSYSPTSLVSNTTFSWIRPDLVGISTSGSSGTDGINETIVNGSNVPLQVPYNYTLTANGCVNAQLVNVTVNPVPTMFNPGNQLACNNSTKVINFSGSIVSGTSYLWTNDNPSIGVPAVGTGDIFFVASTSVPDSVYANINVQPEAYSCRGPVVTFKIIINPPLSLSSSLNPPAVCSNSLFGYTPSSTASNPIYIWNRAGVNGISNSPASGSGTIQEILVNTTSAPISVLYDFTLSSNGCVKSETVSVQVSPALVLDNANISNEVCSGSAFTFSPNGNITGIPYLWSRVAVTGISNPGSNGTGDINETLVNTTTSPIEVGYRYTLGVGASCAADQIVKVTVKPIPQLTGSKTLQSCSNAPVAYTPVGSIPGTNFNWSRAAVPGISNTSAVGLVGISESLINTTAATVNAIYTYNLTNYNGCSNVELVTVGVKPAPVANGGASVDQSICADEITKPVIFSSSLPNTTFNWTNSEPSIGLAASGSGSSIPAFKSVNTSSGQLVAVIQVFPVSNGCTGNGVTAARITVNRAITTSFIETKPTVACEGQVVGPFIASVPLGGDGSTYVFQWQISTDSVNFTNIPGGTARQLIAPPVTTPKAWYRMNTTSLGCSAVTPWAEVARKLKPVITIENRDDSTVSKGNSTQVIASGAFTYLWTPPLTVSDFRSASPYLSPLTNTKYTVLGTTSDGCSDSASITIKVVLGFKVYPNNILTPNGDGYNDIWKIKNIEYYPNNIVKVYNLQGAIVFTKEAYAGDWNGTYTGGVGKLPSGTYYYSINLDVAATPAAFVKGYLTILN